MIVVLLAAGRGRRYQSSTPKSEKILAKPLAKFKGESVISRLLKQIQKINYSKVFIVVGHQKESIIREVEQTKNFSYKIIENTEYHKDENLKSVSLALNNANGNSSALIVETDTIIEDGAFNLYINSLEKLLLCNKFKNSKYVVWSTTGFFQNWNKGGIVYKANRLDKPISNGIEYAKGADIVTNKSREFSSDEYKMGGLTLLSSKCCEEIIEYEAKYTFNIENKNFPYFHKSIFESNNIDHYLYDFGRRMSAYNTYDDLKKINIDLKKVTNET